MPTRHRTPTSTYQNQNIERVSNRHLQKWKACQERICRNVNKQERYQPPPNTPPTPPTPPPQKTLACRQPNYHRKHVTKHSKNSRKCKEAQENRVKRGMKWVIRRIRKPEKTTTLRDALKGTSPKTRPPGKINTSLKASCGLFKQHFLYIYMYKYIWSHCFAPCD